MMKLDMLRTRPLIKHISIGTEVADDYDSQMQGLSSQNGFKGAMG